MKKRIPRLIKVRKISKHPDTDPWKQPMKEIFAKFKLEENTIDFLGHAIAMYSNDNYLNLPAIDTIHRIKLYMDSIGRYGDSPFLYPIYGLGGIPEGFSRYCAIHGGTYMLNTPVEEIIFNEEGKVTGIKSGDQVAKAPLVICDPSYAQGAVGKTKAIGKTIRCINILDHPIPNTNDLPSCQVIIPQRQTGRNSGKNKFKQ